jgi:hypothetical protein
MESHDTTTPGEQPNQAQGRKPYHKPQLQVYGDLTEITKSQLGSGMSDGAAHPNMHFTS